MSFYYNYSGGGVYQSKPITPDDDLESINIDDSVEYPSVLLITTHGEYDSQELISFKSTMNIKKINAVISGVCNYLSVNESDNIANTIINNINELQITDMDNGALLIQKMLKDMLKKMLKNNKINFNDLEYTQYTRQTNRAYEITSVNIGEYIIDKKYTVYPGDRINSHSPFYDSITLLTEEPYNDLIQEILGRTTRKEIQEVTLSTILSHIYITKNIQNLIIVDLSCSITTHIDDRTNRIINRHKERYKMGGYNRKTKKNKKKNYKKSKRSKKNSKKRVK